MGQGHPGGQHQGGMNVTSLAFQRGTLMKLPRRQFLHLAASAAALPAVSRIAQAQAYPSRPVRIVVPFPPGGNIDLIARMTGELLSRRLGQPFIIENRPGAGTHVGTEAVVRSAADGYTLLLASLPAAINATLYEKLNFNFIRDIAPVASVIGAPFVMEINPSLSAKTVPEFIAYAKSNPGKLSMATAGIGTGPHWPVNYSRLWPAPTSSQCLIEGLAPHSLIS